MKHLLLAILLLVSFPLIFLEETMPKKKNHLKDETSPYLLQHVYNPVDWYPWGDKAFEKAKKENKPIFLSVGYSSCHWCHVMEEESFANEEIAKILNEHFVSIKVDREERPDVDKIYMEVVRMMSGSGGWPMSVFMTADKKPFFGGTYFPPEDKYGKPGFNKVLGMISKAWQERKEEILTSANNIAEDLKEYEKTEWQKLEQLKRTVFEESFLQLKDHFDSVNGGFSSAPKFPNVNALRFLLQHYYFTQNNEALNMATKTLDKMAQGGLYDHIGGGFHRYSVDHQWLVPHFEKMLYDNAQLLTTYLEAFQVTKNPFYQNVALETAHYLKRDLLKKEGGFSGSQDADSEKEEGKFYIWSYDDLKKHLSESEFNLFIGAYNIKPDGNFSSHESYHKSQNIPHLTQSSTIAENELIQIKNKLLGIRAKRVPPAIDDKVIVSWNALAVSAFCKLFEVFQKESDKEIAVKSAQFLFQNLFNEKLHATYRDNQAKHLAVLDDYAYLIAACLDLYMITFDEIWVQRSISLLAVLDSKFYNQTTSLYFYSDIDQSDLIARLTPITDDALPNANSVMAINLLKLYKLTYDDSYKAKADKIMKSLGTFLSKHPMSNLKLLEGYSLLLNPGQEIVVLSAQDSDTVELLKKIQSRYLPNRILAVSNAANKENTLVQLLKDKKIVNNALTIYLCRDFVCKEPVPTWEELEKQLK